ncbi:hypothetical protein ACH5RR_040558 [Cinchona calisaya]|uniref:Uncharacterized protein n=1 Tax=Cinchona calisaya TaxID=153742 RepID=A0ABD2XS03_9GENT
MDELEKEAKNAFANVKNDFLPSQELTNDFGSKFSTIVYPFDEDAHPNPNGTTNEMHSGYVADDEDDSSNNSEYSNNCGQVLFGRPLGVWDGNSSLGHVEVGRELVGEDLIYNGHGVDDAPNDSSEGPKVRKFLGSSLRDKWGNSSKKKGNEGVSNMGLYGISQEGCSGFGDTGGNI